MKNKKKERIEGRHERKKERKKERKTERKKEKPLYFYAEACTYFGVVFLGKCTGCAGIIP